MPGLIRDAIRNASIAAIAAGGAARLYRRAAGRSAPLLRVLNLHDVPDAAWLTGILRFVKARYHIVTPAACFEQLLDSSRLNVLITLDDGYASWVNVALPVMAAHDTKAIFFVNSGLLDAYDDEPARQRYIQQRLLISARDTLSWEGLRALHAAGHTIGGHTASHVRVSALQPRQLSEEIGHDKRRIETMLGASITAFAYPFGEHAQQAEPHLRNAGYTHAFSNEPSFATLRAPTRITRMPVDDGASMAAVKYMIEGGVDVYERMKTLIGLTRAKRAFAEAR